MANEVILSFKITDSGTIQILDQAGKKLDEIATKAETVGQRGAAGFSALEARIISVNQALQLGQSIGAEAKRFFDSVFAPLQQADQFNKLSQSIGLSVRDLTGLSVSASLANVTVNELGRGVGFFARQIAEGNPLLRTLGITSHDVNTALGQLADVFVRLPDGPTKTAIASQLLSRNYRELIPLFNQGSEALAAQRRESEELALVYGKDFSQATANALDNQKRLDLALAGIRLTIAGELLPVLAEVTSDTLGWIKANESLIHTDVRSWAHETAEGVRDLRNSWERDFFSWIFDQFERVSQFAGGLPGAVTPEQSKLLGGLARTRQDREALDAAIAAGRGFSSTAEQFTPVPPGFRVEAPHVTDSDLERRARAALENGKAAKEAAEQARAAHAAELQIQTAEVAAIESGLTLRKAELSIATDRAALLRGGVNSEQAQLDLAARRDEIERAGLQIKLASLEAEQESIRSRLQTGAATAEDLGNLIKSRNEWEAVTLTIAKAPTEVDKLTAALERSHRVTVDLGASLESSLQRAVDGILQSGGSFNVLDIAKGTGEALASEIAGGFLKAELSKNQFDAMVTENFSVTLPGIFRTGADALTNTWSRAMEFLRVSTSDATAGIRGDVSQTVDVIGGKLRNVPGVGDVTSLLGGGSQVAFARDAAGRLVATNEFGQTFAGPASQASQIVSAASGVGGVSGGPNVLGALGGVGLVASGATQGDIGGLIQGAVGGAIAGAALGIGAALGAGIGAAIVVGITGLIVGIHDQGAARRAGFDVGSLGLGKIFGLNRNENQILAAVLTGGNSLWVNELAKKAGFGQTPTLEHREASVFGKLLSEAGVPLITRHLEDQVLGRPIQDIVRVVFSGGRTPGEPVNPLGRQLLDSSPAPEELRSPIAGLGTAVFKDVGAGAAFANTFTNNARLLGLTVKQTQQYLDQFLLSIKVDLPSALGSLNEAFLGSRINYGVHVQEDYNKAVADTVTLMTHDLPPGVDAAAIALRNFDQQHGKNVIDIQAFNKDLQEQVDLFGSLRDASRGAVRGGIGSIVSVLASGGTPQEASNAAQRQMLSTLEQSATDAFSRGLLDAVQESPGFKAYEQALANAVSSGSGDLSAAINLIPQIFNTLGPAMFVFAKGIKVVQDALGVIDIATNAHGDASGIRNTIEAAQLTGLNSRQRRAALEQRIAGVDTQERILRKKFQLGQINETEFINQDRALLGRRQGYGEQLLNDNPFAPGSAAWRRQQQEGITVLSQTADRIDALGNTAQAFIDHQAELALALEHNTIATDRNTNGVITIGLDPNTPGLPPPTVGVNNPPAGGVKIPPATGGPVYVVNPNDPGDNTSVTRLGSSGYVVATSRPVARGSASDSQLAAAIRDLPDRLASVMAKLPGDTTINAELNVEGTSVTPHELLREFNQLLVQSLRINQPARREIVRIHAGA